MKISIVYSSKTGNTKLLAQTIMSCFDKEDVVYCGEMNSAAINAERVFVGFWTDKGTCDEKVAEFLKGLHEKQVFLFGTAGFGGSEIYFQQILERVMAYLDDSNQVVGSYMCQGKMLNGVRDRYVALQKEHPEDPKYEKMILMFDHALTHPDQDDLEKLKQLIQESNQ